MKISELKQELAKISAVNFKLPDGSYVPSHFHVTEVGLITKHFIDCGGMNAWKQSQISSFGKRGITITDWRHKNFCISLTCLIRY